MSRDTVPDATEPYGVRDIPSYPNSALGVNIHESVYLVSPRDNLVVDVGDVHTHCDVIAEKFSHNAPKNVEMKIRPR